MKPSSSNVVLVAVASAASIQPLTALAAATEGIGVQRMLYQESDDRMRVEYTQVQAAKDFGTDFSLGVTASVDEMTGATPAVDARTGASAMTGSGNLLGDGLASPDGYTTHLIDMEDTRESASAALTWRTKNRHEWTGGISWSEEEDYKSQGFSISHLHHLDQSRNRSLSVGYSQLNNEALFYRDASWRDATYRTVEIGLTEVLTPTWLVQGALFAMHEHGALSNPYKRIIRKVNVAEPDGVTFRYFLSPDSRPDERNVSGVSLKTARQETIAGIPNYLHGYYRWYADNWGVKAHTIEGRVLIGDIDASFGQFILLGRYYRQDRASFYRSSTSVFDEHGYGSVDERLGSYHSTTWGIGWERHLSDHWVIHGRMNRQHQSHGLDMIWNWAGVDYVF